VDRVPIPVPLAGRQPAGQPAGSAKTWAQVATEGLLAYATQSRSMFQGVTNPGCSRFGMTESFVPFQPNVNPDGSLNPNAGLDKSIFFGATMPDPGGLPLGSLLYETFSKFFNVAGDSFQVTVHTKSGSGTAWAQQMTRYLASVGKTPADLYYAQVWDPSGRSASMSACSRPPGSAPHRSGRRSSTAPARIPLVSRYRMLRCPGST
jgi:hypothetical protein